MLFSSTNLITLRGSRNVNQSDCNLAYLDKQVFLFNWLPESIDQFIQKDAISGLGIMF